MFNSEGGAESGKYEQLRGRREWHMESGPFHGHSSFFGFGPSFYFRRWPPLVFFGFGPASFFRRWPQLFFSTLAPVSFFFVRLWPPLVFFDAGPGLQFFWPEPQLVFSARGPS